MVAFDSFGNEPAVDSEMFGINVWENTQRQVQLSIDKYHRGGVAGL